MRSATDGSAGRKPADRLRSETVVPVIAEEAKAGIRKVVTGSVRVTKRVREHEEKIDQALAREIVEIRRIPKNQVVDGPQPTRHVGDTVIIPIVKQVVRVEWVLEEEIHLIKRRMTERSGRKVTLWREEPGIERTGTIQSEK